MTQYSKEDLITGKYLPEIKIDNNTYLFNPRNLKYKDMQKLKNFFMVGIKMNSNMEPDLTEAGATSTLMSNLEKIKQELAKIIWELDLEFDHVDYITYSQIIEPIDILDPLNLGQKKKD